MTVFILPLKKVNRIKTKTVGHQMENNLLTWNWNHVTYLAESAERKQSTQRTGAPQKCAGTWRTCTGRSGTLIKDSSTDLPLAAVVITKNRIGCGCPDISNVRFAKSDNWYGTYCLSRSRVSWLIHTDGFSNQDRYRFRIAIMEMCSFHPYHLLHWQCKHDDLKSKCCHLGDRYWRQ